MINERRSEIIETESFKKWEWIKLFPTVLFEENVWILINFAFRYYGKNKIFRVNKNWKQNFYSGSEALQKRLRVILIMLNRRLNTFFLLVFRIIDHITSLLSHSAKIFWIFSVYFLQKALTLAFIHFSQPMLQLHA